MKPTAGGISGATARTGVRLPRLWCADGRAASGDAQVVTCKRDCSDSGHGKHGHDPPFGIAVPAIGVETEQTLDPRRPHGRQDRRRPEEG